MRANGVRSLQQPSIYIVAVIAAFLLYYVDRHYGFNYIFSKVSDEAEHMKSHLQINQEDPSSPIDSMWVFVVSVILLSLVLAMKRVMDRRQD